MRPAGPFGRVFPSSSPSTPHDHEHSPKRQHVVVEEMDRNSAGEEDGLVGKVVGRGWMGELEG